MKPHPELLLKCWVGRVFFQFADISGDFLVLGHGEVR